MVRNIRCVEAAFFLLTDVLCLCVQTETPSNRKAHSAVVIGSVMLLYGGFIDMKGSSQDFWSLDFGELFIKVVSDTMLPW